MNFRFQFASGSHSSNPISEAVAGRITPTTRQNAGRSSGATTGWAPRGPGNQGKPTYGSGGRNAPAATRSASVIVVSGSLGAGKPSHDWAAIAPESVDGVVGVVAEAAASVPATGKTIINEYFIELPFTRDLARRLHARPG